VSLNLVDFNADTTQGTIDCTKYGFPNTNTCGPGGVTPCSASNDCDNDGLKEVEVQVLTSGEPNPEKFRLEQTSSGAPTYTALIPISASLNGANDGVVFVATNGTVAPAVNALYFDKDAGRGDANADGIVDSPLNNGVDGCPGFCNSDDDKNAVGPDK